MFSKMAVLRTALCCLLFFVFLCCCSGFPRGRNRFKRALDDDDIIAALKLYQSQMTQMENKIFAQEAIMKKQQRRISDIRHVLKRKAEEHDKEDLEGLIDVETKAIEVPLRLVSLDTLVREVDSHESRQTALLKALKRDNVVMDDVHRRVLDNRLICRDTTTAWKDKADGMIRELSRQYVKCNANELIQRFAFQRKDGSWKSKVRYNYRCCHYNMKDNWETPDDW